MKKSVVLLTALLAACGSSTPLFTPDGRPTKLLRCTGDDWSNCQQQADSICGSGGYAILQRDNDGASHTLLVACRNVAP
ncbi:MAG: hypothetical protein ACRYG5_18260 [Janthinobacterium lividum]